MDDMDLLFGDEPYDTKENFEYHEIQLILVEQEDFHIATKVKCLGADKDDCACTKNNCQVEYNTKMVGNEVFRVLEDIDLGTFKARIDWSDPEEPYIELGELI